MIYVLRVKLLLFVFIAIFTLPKAKADEISLGFAFKDHVYIYADSSLKASVVDTLEFTDHIFTYGIKKGAERKFNFNGWIKVGDEMGPNAWAVYNDLAVTKKVLAVVSPGDSIFAEINGGKSFSYLQKHEGTGYFSEHIYKNHSHWLRLLNGTWLKVKKINYEIADTYHDLMFKLWGRFTFGFFGEPNNEENYDKAFEAIRRFQEKVHPETLIYTQDFVYTGMGTTRRIIKLRSGAFVTYLKYRTHLALKQYNDAISELQKLALLYENEPLGFGKAGVFARLEIGSLYENMLKDTVAALQQYHEVVRKYPDEEIASSERLDWWDQKAASAIILMLWNNPFLLARAAEQIVSESPVTTVKMIGYTGVVRSLGLQNLYLQMVDTAYTVIQHNLDDKRNLYFSTFYSAFSVASAVFETLYENGEIERYKEFANQLKISFKDYPIAWLSEFMLANMIDKTDGDISQVNKAFEQIIDDHGEFEAAHVYDRITGNSFAPRFALPTRLSQLKEAGLSDAEITTQGTELRMGFGNQFPVQEILPAGVHVKVLYSDEGLKYTAKMIETLHSKTSLWTKIELADHIIGWVSSSNLKFVNKNLFQEEQSSAPSWTTEFGNSQNNAVFMGDQINVPIVNKILDGNSTDGMRFAKIDSDKYIDLIFQEIDSDFKYSIVAINGKNQNKVSSFKTSSLTGHAIANGKLFMSTVPIDMNDSYKIQAYDLQTGNLFWEYKDVTRFCENLLYFDQKLYAVSGFNSVIALNAETGELTWRSFAGALNNEHHIHFTTHIGVNNSALVLASEDSLFAFKPQTGESIWRQAMKLRRIQYQPPILDDTHVFVTTSEWLNAINLLDGKIHWQVDIKNAMLGQIFVTNDKLFYTVNYRLSNTMRGDIFAVDKTSGTLLWQYEFGYLAWRGVADSKRLYIKGSRNRDSSSIVALAQINGELKWEFPIPSIALRYPVLYQSDKLFLNGHTGVIVLEDSLSVLSALSNLSKFQLFQNYPNPFNSSTTLSYELQEAENVTLIIYNILGQHVRKLVDGFQYRGHYKVLWDGLTDQGNKASSSIYFFELKIGNENSIRSMIIVK